jgi:hypothetical protein
MIIIIISSHVRMCVMKKAKEKKYWGGCEEDGAHVHCWLECKLIEPS